MYLPWPSVTPEAVRISVSMRSLMTVALAGMTPASSLSDACRHDEPLGKAWATVDESRSIRNARKFSVKMGLVSNTASENPLFRAILSGASDGFKLIGRIGCFFRPARKSQANDCSQVTPSLAPGCRPVTSPKVDADINLLMDTLMDIQALRVACRQAHSHGLKVGTVVADTCLVLRVTRVRL